MFTHLEQPSQQLVMEVADHVREVLGRLVCEGFKEYPRLLAVVESVVRRLPLSGLAALGPRALQEDD